MTVINLLPWRERSRAQNKKRLIIASIVIIFSVLVIDATWFMILQGKRSAQQARNTFLQKEIAQADKTVKGKEKFNTEKQEVMDQMNSLKELNNQRFRMVELVDVLPKILPDGTYVTSVNVKKNYIEIQGQAPADLQVNELIKQIREKTNWKNLQLHEIKSEGITQFRISFKIED